MIIFVENDSPPAHTVWLKLFIIFLVRIIEMNVLKRPIHSICSFIFLIIFVSCWLHYWFLLYLQKYRTLNNIRTICPPTVFWGEPQAFMDHSNLNTRCNCILSSFDSLFCLSFVNFLSVFLLSVFSAFLYFFPLSYAHINFQ